MWYFTVSYQKINFRTEKALSNDLVSHDFLDPVEKFFVEKCKKSKNVSKTKAWSTKDLSQP